MSDREMKLQVLVSCMNQNPHELAEKMNLSSDAIIINQCDHDGEEIFQYREREISCYFYRERGVGKSRNHALKRADRDICLFSDEDIVYRDGYEEQIVEAFKQNPKADMIVFNVEVIKERQTYFNTQQKRVHFYNCGRYGAVSFAFRTVKLKEAGIEYSPLFGGGAKYSNGEDSLFIKDFMSKHYKVYTSPVIIGKEVSDSSTWFSGYNEKFFFDRGVLYHFLYGKLAIIFSLRFLLAHRGKLCKDMKLKQAFRIMKSGIKQGKKEAGV